MATFGWSAGDIIATLTVVDRIRRSISGAHDAREHFQELDTELQALSRALDEISDLVRLPGQIPEIEALKFASCLCHETLSRFYEKLRPFENTLGIGSKVSKLKASPKMVRWELLVRKDVPELRTYLVAHVGSLNLRLSAALLKAASRSQSQAARQGATLTSVHRLNMEQSAVLDKISKISSEDTIPKLDSLLAIAIGVWRSQNEILVQLAKSAEKLPPPDLSHTWAQEPIKFEDALGRRFIVPSEYDWDKLEAIIQAQFKNGAGRLKVRSGEYELFDRNSGIPLSGLNFTGMIPGSTVIMTFIMGKYRRGEPLKSCVHIRCGSSSVRKINSDASICINCHSFFRTSFKPLPRPMKPIFGDAIATATIQESLDTVIRDRYAYKNVSLYLVDLPANLPRFREKYPREVQVDAPSQQISRPLARSAALRRTSTRTQKPKLNQFSNRGANRTSWEKWEQPSRKCAEVSESSARFPATIIPSPKQAEQDPCQCKVTQDDADIEKGKESFILKPSTKRHAAKKKKRSRPYYEPESSETEADYQVPYFIPYREWEPMEWPLLRIVRCLMDNKFSHDWLQAIVDEELYGPRFIERIEETHPPDFHLMICQAQPGKGTAIKWQTIAEDQLDAKRTKMRDEGKRLFELIRRLNDKEDKLEKEAMIGGEETTKEKVREGTTTENTMTRMDSLRQIGRRMSLRKKG